MALPGHPLHYAAAVLRDAQPLRAGIAIEPCALPVLLVVDSDEGALFQLNRKGLACMQGEVQLATFSGKPCIHPSDCQTQQMSTLVTRWLIGHLLPAHANHGDNSYCSCRPCSE